MSSKQLKNFIKFYERGTFADATVVCKGRKWKVHKLVLASKSEYFLKAFGGPFKESHSATIDLSEDDENCVNALIHYCYHDEYIREVVSGTLQSFLIHLEVYLVADKYLAPGLCSLAELRFNSLIFAQTTRRQDSFAQTVMELYLPIRSGSNDAVLKFRGKVVAAAALDIDYLFRRDDTCARFKEVVWSTPAFTAELLKKITYDKWEEEKSDDESATSSSSED